MSFGGSPSGTTNSVQSSEPWGGVQPYLSKMFHLGNYELDQARSGATPSLAPQSAWTRQAQETQANRAAGGHALNHAAQNSTLGTVRGDYLDPTTNPAWNPMVKRMTDAYQIGTAAPLDAKFGKSGNAFMDNSAYKELRGINERAFGDSLSGLAGSLYNTERDRMLKGSLIAPQLANQDYVDIGKLGEVGAQLDVRAQQETDQPWDQLTRFQRLISGQPGGTVNMQQPYFSNDVSNLLGMGLMGATIYDLLG